MSVTVRRDRGGAPSRPGPWVSRSWAAVVLIPVFFVLAFALGYVLYDLFGYKPENDDAPLWVELTTTFVVLTVSLMPCVAAVMFGRHAATTGDRRGLAPMGIGMIAGVGLIVLSITTLIA